MAERKTKKTKITTTERKRWKYVDASISELRKSVDAIDKVIKSLFKENL